MGMQAVAYSKPSSNLPRGQKPFCWRDAPELMARLTSAQNHPTNDMIDIVTFAGFCSSEAELLRHVKHYEQRAISYVAPKRQRRAG